MFYHFIALTPKNNAASDLLKLNLVLEEWVSFLFCTFKMFINFKIMF